MEIFAYIFSVITIGADMETVTKVVKDIMKHLDKVGSTQQHLRVRITSGKMKNRTFIDSVKLPPPNSPNENITKELSGNVIDIA